jgi:hypothetical protein
MSAILKRLTALSSNEYEGLFELAGREYMLNFEVKEFKGRLIVTQIPMALDADSLDTYHIRSAVMAMHIAHQPAFRPTLEYDADLIEAEKAKLADQFSGYTEAEQQHLLNQLPSNARSDTDDL